MAQMTTEQRRTYYGSFTYVKGLRDYNVKLIAGFAFPGDYIDVIKNNKTKTFDVLVQETVDIDMAEWFLEYFNKDVGERFRIFKKVETKDGDKLVKIELKK